jgi:hypothetical protein
MLQLTTQIRLTEQDAQPVLSFIVQVLGDVAQEVEMTGQRGMGRLRSLMRFSAAYVIARPRPRTIGQGVHLRFGPMGKIGRGAILDRAAWCGRARRPSLLGAPVESCVRLLLLLEVANLGSEALVEHVDVVRCEGVPCHDVFTPLHDPHAYSTNVQDI